MRRRHLVAALPWSLLAWSPSGSAQQPAIPVVGYLSASSARISEFTLAVFRDGLKQSGYVEGQNVAIEWRWAEGHYDRLPALAADLVGRKVDVIVTGGGATGALAGC